ncbi:uncharacterized protein (DUF1810 family) [Hymenobacter luteus]|uniref:Uncharacterized protein (DUF1810 family) n=2 Tax=Hymenobacter TaxID=89966 RepID=A0A7W9T1F7_9BACT|nr:MULTISPECIES: DUF1810 domain-containing protein [Hymenobacter]MBB4601831.1 uncharacterized protein (DUF1810 family) [Hymenobacter latericoloratus]MBB6059740.1 uncharacterized protein (DUF1810 family) [Hymenobacter luteus]
MASQNDLQRFLDAQRTDYPVALAEIKNGRKRSHWMWYIFPQIRGLGFSETSKFYAIQDRAEAEAYLQHPVLGPRLLEISRALLALPGTNATAIFGSPDDVKLKSSMTLFSCLPHADPVFEQVLDKFFHGDPDGNTLQQLSR